MTPIRFALKAATLVVATALTAACGGGSQPPAATEKIVATEAGEMSPEEAGGMIAGEPAEAPAASKAPHGGTVVKLGTVAALEFVHDPSSGMLTAYVLNGAASGTVRSAATSIDVEVTAPGGAKVQVSLMSTANGLTGDTVGNSSQFGGAQAGLKGVTAFTGVVKQFAAAGETFANVAFGYPVNN